MMVVKPHLAQIGNKHNQDTGLDSVWCREPGRPDYRVALAQRMPSATVICLDQLSEVQIDEIKAALRDRDCERPVSNGLADLTEAAVDNRLVAIPPEEIAEDDDIEDDDEG